MIVGGVPRFGGSSLSLTRSTRNRHGQLSPDGRWLAYFSDESGRREVYVMPFAPEDAAAGKPAGGKWQISTAGGQHPRWRGDERELFYLEPSSRKLMAAEVRASGGTFDHGKPQPLFELRITPDNYTLTHPYAASADGNRFLVGAEGEGPGEALITVVTNWPAAVRK